MTTPWWRKALDVVVAFSIGGISAGVSLIAMAAVVRLWFGRDAHGWAPILVLAVGTVAGAVCGGWLVARAQYLGWLFRG